MKSSDNLLMVADSEHDANMLYAVGMFVPDPFIYLRLRGRASIVMSDLEIDRARRDAPHCRPLSLGGCQDKLRKAGVKSPGHAQVIASILRERKIRRVLVPPNFPLGLAGELQRLRISVQPTPRKLFPAARTETAAEVKKISAALMMAEVGMSEAMQVLRGSKIGRDRRLMYHNIPLTAEKLRAVIDTAILQAGGLAANTIVAGGKQGCDPHERGFGPLARPGADHHRYFPALAKHGLFRRHHAHGGPGPRERRGAAAVRTVRRGQKIGFDKMRAGVPTADVHRAVLDYFAQQGYKTGRRAGRMEGFFHGTGHGLGLEIHEAPRMGQHSQGKLLAGQVVTVEPGLYYPELGGVRLEDVALVTRNGARNLTQFEKTLEL